MVTAEEGSTICILVDSMPDSTQKRQKLLVRPSYKVSTLLEDIRRQFSYDTFLLRLQTTKESKPIYLNNFEGKTLVEAGVKFDPEYRNQLVIEHATFNDNSMDTHDSDHQATIAATVSSTTTDMVTDEGTLGAESDIERPAKFNIEGMEKIINKKSSRDDELWSEDDDLALGASASPTEGASYAVPIPPAPPALPPAFDYMDASSSKQTSFRRLNSGDRSNHFVGLVNQAMTCYLNSLLQALYMTPEFRNALYNWEFDDKDESKSIPYQLQKLFLNLQTSTKLAVETTDLTRSFGWDSTEAWQQHDIQELCRVMFDALEQKFKNTKQADLINKLYEGKMIDYVKCLECGTEKQREDTFLDIPLPVRPFGSTVAYESVEEAIQAFVQPETLDGNNQYLCEKCNKKCDAHKGLKFSKFPYILTMHLKRFDFDYQTLHRIKLNDKVTFPQTLNLNGFIKETIVTPVLTTEQPASTPSGGQADTMSIGQESVESAVKCDDCSTTDSGSALEDDSLSGANYQAANQDQDLQDDDEGIDMAGDAKSTASASNETGPYLYQLFAIMIHSGSASGGHYYAYIKDFESGNWYSFNDQTVSSITQEDIQRSFGGSAYKTYYSSAYSSSTNAYMLMYRQIDPTRNTKFIKEDSFPEHIKQLKEQLKVKEEDDRKTREYQTDLAKIKIFFSNPKLQRMTDAKMFLAADATLSEVVEDAHRRLAKGITGELKQFRLVAYDSSSETIERSFEGREEETIGEIMNSLKNNNNELLLEMRPEDEEFDVYQPGGIITKVYQIDLNSNDIDGPVQVRGLLSGTVFDYKKTVAKRLRLNPNHLVLVKIGASSDQNSGAEFSCSIATVLDDDTITLMEEKLHLSHKIFVAQVPQISEETKQKVKKIVERFEHVITLYFLLPTIDKENLDRMSIPPYEPDVNAITVSPPSPKPPQTPSTPTASWPASQGTDCVDAVGFGGHSQSSRRKLDVYGGDYSRRVSPLPPLEATECNSEDSSLSDSDRTLVDTAQDDLSHLSSSSNSPACSDPGQLSSPDDSNRGAISDCDPDNDVEMSAAPSPIHMPGHQQHHHHQHSQPHKQRSYYFRATPYIEVSASIDGESQQMLKVLVDRSMTIGTLKQHLEPVISVSHQYFKIFYMSDATTRSNTECSRLNDTLSGFKDGERLMIELGRVLQKGETRCKLHYLNLKEIDDETERIPFLCEWVIKEGDTVGQTKREILNHVTRIDPKYQHLTPDNCWLRKKSYKTPTKALTDEQIFGDDIYLTGTEIQLVLQELNENSPKYTNPDDVLFFVRRWYPSTRTLGEFQEIVLTKESGELRNILSQLSGIPEENIEVTKLSNSFPRCSVSNVSVANLIWNTQAVTTNSWPEPVDGTLYFYKDKTEPLKELTEEERLEMTNKKINEISASSRTSSYSPKRERALKIYLDSSPKKRDD